MDFGHEERGCEECHDGEGGGCLGDFHADLVFKEFGVLEGGFVEDEGVGEGGKYEVNYQTEQPGFDC